MNPTFRFVVCVPVTVPVDFQKLKAEHRSLTKELEQVIERAFHQLREERSKTSTLLLVLEKAPVKAEADLLKDNRQLVLQLHQSEAKIEVRLLKCDRHLMGDRPSFVVALVTS